MTTRKLYDYKLPSGDWQGSYSLIKPPLTLEKVFTCLKMDKCNGEIEDYSLSANEDGTFTVFYKGQECQKITPRFSTWEKVGKVMKECVK